VPLLAAITTIVLLATGPFAQQSVKTTLCRKVLGPAEPALIPVAAKLPLSDVVERGQVGPVSLPASALNAVRAGLTTPSSGSTFNLPFVCRTGNCTFPEFKGITHSSLGLCNSCQDVTPTVVELPESCPTDEDPPSYTSCEYEVAPRNGPKANITPASVRFNIVPSAQKSVFDGSYFNDVVPFDWVNVTLLTRSLAGCEGENGKGGCTPKYPHLPGLQNANDFNFTIVAAQCSLYPCIKHYRGEIRGGELFETVVSTTKLRANYTTDTGASINLAAVADPCLVNGTWYDDSTMDSLIPQHGSISVNGSAHSPAPLPCVYQIPNTWMYIMTQELNTTMAGECTATAFSKSGFLTHFPSYCENWWLSSLWNNGSATFENVTGIFDNVAAGVTNYMRAVGLRWDAADSDSSRPTRADLALVGGTAEQTDLCIQFDWMWLLLPTILTLVTVGLLVASIVRTYLNGEATPAWKSSLLPLLFHGFRDKGGEVTPDHRMGLKELETTAKAMVVSYAPDEHGGCGIVLEEGSSLRRRHGGGEGYEHVES
jgi:hypothetical protein